MTCATRGCSVKSGGNVDDALAERLAGARISTPRLHALGPVVCGVLAPVDGVLVADHAERGARLRAALVEPLAVLLDHRGGIGLGEHALGDQLVGVQLAARSDACG